MEQDNPGFQRIGLVEILNMLVNMLQILRVIGMFIVMMASP